MSFQKLWDRSRTDNQRDFAPAVQRNVTVKKTDLINPMLISDCAAAEPWLWNRTVAEDLLTAAAPADLPTYHR